METLSKLERLKLKIDKKTLKKKISILKIMGSKSLDERFAKLELQADLRLTKYLLKEDAKSKRIKAAIVGFETIGMAVKDIKKVVKKPVKKSPHPPTKIIK